MLGLFLRAVHMKRSLLVAMQPSRAEMGNLRLGGYM